METNNLEFCFFFRTETAMGHKRMGKDDDGFKYAMVS